ncbi:receptor-binding cancer antigen expressed on SiSo cells isoform X1 [Physeter macrocephalus]|uniref:Receptor-binding cancer antigen expressed on SiSo cells isoform X1 n=1 Tax=Physeter macrocephalus TaxID=9755 RepID=A0A2Y9T6K2_PHYMC|nr:receptor-binding cancer antigen expressed on SiSo cells isoform X1 [Physeter catodon]|eukprot:XP_023985217.1 receptor-binding cancer antigen expressed on SiSo cells isoform X1 [Physeter catodon]
MVLFPGQGDLWGEGTATRSGPRACSPHHAGSRVGDRAAGLQPEFPSPQVHPPQGNLPVLPALPLQALLLPKQIFLKSKSQSTRHPLGAIESVFTKRRTYGVGLCNLKTLLFFASVQWVLIPTMAITQFRLFKVCTCLATVFSFLKRLICRSGRGRKLSGDQITLPTTVDYSSVPKQTDVEEWTSWDEDAPTSVKIEGGNGNVATQQNALEQLEPDYFKDMTPTIRKTQKIIIKKREPLNFGIPDGSTGFSSRLAATQDMPFIHQSPELGDLDTWQENTNAWEEEEDAAWQAEEVLRQQKIADREKRAAEQQRKKMEKEAQRLMKKEQNKIGVKLS